MSERRRYDEDEIAEILERATFNEGAEQPASRGSGQGLTLEEIQDIGSEVGIPPARIADAARAMASRSLAGPPKTFLGAPRSVSRILPLERAMKDEEWARLVADLRETFDAVGTTNVHGNTRMWRNGNLHVYVEPHGDRYRVRMRTEKGNVLPRMAVSATLMFTAAVLALDSFAGGAVFREIVPALMLGAMGVGTLAVTRAALPKWAMERAVQMEGLAERIPLLLKE